MHSDDSGLWDARSVVPALTDGCSDDWVRPGEQMGSHRPGWLGLGSRPGRVVLPEASAERSAPKAGSVERYVRRRAPRLPASRGSPAVAVYGPEAWHWGRSAAAA
ncbi:MAG: hypothetical protein OEN00_08575 [Gemmatimonadota bacterium]|nr:hypothetical protein [Gemmatimonadota bacterium]